MSRKKIIGICKICRTKGPLSFEHVPPKSAFNNQKFYYETIKEVTDYDDFFEADFDELYRKRIVKRKQGGIGFYSLCHSCNNFTGSNYANSFVQWVYQALGILQKAKGKPALYYPTFFFPLRVLKQIITMFFSVNHSIFSENERELARFILNKEERFLDKRFRIYCYYNIQGTNRYIGNNFIGKIGGYGPLQISEITFPPFGFVMTIDSKRNPDFRLTDISHFAGHRYNDWIDHYQKFDTLPTYLPQFPLDYRSRHEIKKALEE